MIEKINDKISVVLTEEGFLSSNCVMVKDGGGLAIDSGAGKILKEVSPEKARTLLLSHHHLDHINGNDLFVNARIYAHPLERKAMMNPEKTTATSGWQDLMGDDIMNHAQQIGGVKPRILEPWESHEDLSDGMEVRAGGTLITVLHTPGHTAGHCSFYFPDEGFVFTGDICLTKVGPWYGDPDVEIDGFLNSIQKIIALRPKKLATGHLTGVLDADIAKRLTEYGDRIFRREKRILKLLAEGPMTINELADRKPIYPLHPTTFVLFWEKSMIKKHLERLVKTGLAEEAGNGKYAAVK
ncbi:MAG: MBL fold metallo-hydrolase [Spirochaetes bacterium]|nr:MBL fold metallo-hydrolase [Spirochaetota bacterium]